MNFIASEKASPVLVCLIIALMSPPVLIHVPMAVRAIRAFARKMSRLTLNFSAAKIRSNGARGAHLDLVLRASTAQLTKILILMDEVELVMKGQWVAISRTDAHGRRSIDIYHGFFPGDSSKVK